MDANITLKISKNTITISQIKNDINDNLLNKTNVIDVNDFKFSVDYIKTNFELVASFLNVIILRNDITYAIINEMEIAEVAMDLINSWEHIKLITFQEEAKIPMHLFLKILDNKYIEEINCYEISNYLIERLDMNTNIKVTTRHSYDHFSKFMITNNLNKYSDIFYKKSIILRGSFNHDDLDDLNMFFKFNNKLKNIKIVHYSSKLLDLIMKEIIDNDKSHITIEINETGNDINHIYETINRLRKENHKYIEEFHIKFKINYSKEYKYKYFFKELTFKLFASIFLFAALICAVFVITDYYRKEMDAKKIENTLDNIEDIVNNQTETSTSNISESTDTTNTSKTIKTTIKTTNALEGIDYNQSLDELVKINNDTVGWIMVNDTKINYPVVKTTDNDYYLTHDFNHKNNRIGWIFMDYRNDIDYLDRNTIIYGHNMRQGLMFGTIKNMMEKSWYTKNDNQIIEFNTANKIRKWKIFSLYQIKETDDYLKVKFSSDDEFLSFIDILKARSKYNFNVNIKGSDKILTLSTCSTTGTRHVVHAVLIEETS